MNTNKQDPSLEDTYRLSDVDAASWLAYKGFDLLRIEPPPPDAVPPHSQFVFRDSAGLSTAVGRWYNDAEDISVEDVQRYQKIKTRLYRRAREAAEGVRR